MPIPAPMPAPESPRSPAAVPQPDNNTAASIPTAIIRIRGLPHLIVGTRLIDKMGEKMTRMRWNLSPQIVGTAM
jgi:hypothetical protein